MIVIENLPATNADIHESLLSRRPIRDSYVVTSLTGSSGKASSGRRNGGRNKTIVDKIKNILLIAVAQQTQYINDKGNIERTSI